MSGTGKKDKRCLRAAGLFAGIGGLESGLKFAGHKTKLLCEVNEAALAVLKARFPRVPRETDMRELDALPSDVDLVVAGFPCQDLSQAGRTRGIRGDRSNLVTHVFRLLEGQRVPWLLLENVPFMLQLEQGAGIRFLADSLEKLGYRWAYRVVDSRSFGVPQRRLRVFFLASLEENPARMLFKRSVPDPGEPERTKTSACGFYWTEGLRGLGWAVNAVPTLKGGSGLGIPSPPAIWLPDGTFVTPDIRDAERLQGFPEDWTRPSESVARPSHRWTLVGNAVTVNSAMWIADVLGSPAERLPLATGSLPANATWPRAGFGEAGRRFAVDASTWPCRKRQPDLLRFLKYPTKPLSAKATLGFLKRLRAGRLRYPDGFAEALHAHAERMSASAVQRSR